MLYTHIATTTKSNKFAVLALEFVFFISLLLHQSVCKTITNTFACWLQLHNCNSNSNNKNNGIITHTHIHTRRRVHKNTHKNDQIYRVFNCFFFFFIPLLFSSIYCKWVFIRHYAVNSLSLYLSLSNRVHTHEKHTGFSLRWKFVNLNTYRQHTIQSRTTIAITAAKREKTEMRTRKGHIHMRSRSNSNDDVV